jgi:hypothetical protein
MRDKDTAIKPVPDSFETEEEAGAFWDAHSVMDYPEDLELSNDTIEIEEFCQWRADRLAESIYDWLGMD